MEHVGRRDEYLGTLRRAEYAIVSIKKTVISSDKVRTIGRQSGVVILSVSLMALSLDGYEGYLPSIYQIE